MSQGEAAPAHRPQAEALLSELFRLMDYPARLDFKDLPDGALGVAVHFEGEVPGVQGGKRSYLLDCIQFLVNKAVNRPNQPRRWVNLAVDAFPEPRGAHGAAGQAPAPAPEAPPRKEPREARAPRPAQAPAARTPAPPPPSEAAPAPEDPTWTRLGRGLATTATRLGRVYGVMLLSSENRARLQQAASGVAGVSTRVEGDGHWRRLVLTPDKVTPLTKKHVMPDWDDEEAE